MARHSNDSSPPETRSPQSDRIDLALLSLRDETVIMTSPVVGFSVIHTKRNL